MLSKITCSGGGPIIALPAEVAHLWRGTLPPIGVEVPEDWEWGNGDIICDYDRACNEVEDRVSFGDDFFGWLSIRDGKALSFSVPQEITFIPEARGGVIIGNFPDLDTLEELLKTVPSTAWELYPQIINLKDGRLFIFDSAYEGYKNPEEITAFDNVVVAQLSPGTYRIFHHNTENKVGFVRFEKQE
jgi:Immunity protein 21